MRRPPPRLVALGALIAGLVTVALIVFGGDDRYRVTAVFDKAFGLVPSGDVKAGGIDVGEIEEIELGPNGLPRVTMAIDDSYRLRQGATAELRLFSLVGELNRYVLLHQGDGPELGDGATIGAAGTVQPVEFDELLATLPPRTRGDVGTVLARLERATRNRGPDLARSLRHSADALGETSLLLDEVAADGEALRTLIADGRRVIQALASDPSELQGVAERLAPVLETTAAREAELTAGLELLPAGLRSTRSALARLDASIPRLRELVRVSRPAVAELVPFSHELRPTLRVARPALRQASALVRSAPADLRSLVPLLETATPIARTLDSALVLLNPVLDHVRVRAPEVVNFLTLAADAGANYDAAGHGVRLIPIPSDVPREEVEPDESEPGCVVRPFDRVPGVLEAVPWRDYAESFVGGGEPVESFVEEGERSSPGGGAC